MPSEWAAIDRLMRELGAVRNDARGLDAAGTADGLAEIDRLIAAAAQALDNTIAGSTESPPLPRQGPRRTIPAPRAWSVDGRRRASSSRQFAADRIHKRGRERTAVSNTTTAGSTASSPIRMATQVRDAIGIRRAA